MSIQQKIDKIIHFREGFIILSDNRPYFMPIGGNAGYALDTYGKKELMGKHHLALTSATGVKYDLTYEYDGDDFISGRIIHGSYRSKGKDVSPENVAKMNKHLESGQFKLIEKIKEPSVSKACQFSDGRLLLLLTDLLDEKGNILMIQQEDGSYEKKKLVNGIIGGRTVMYKTEDGIPVKFEYGSHAVYGDRMLEEVKQVGTIAAYGLDVKMPPPHLDPFSVITDHIRLVVNQQKQQGNTPRAPGR